MTSSARLPAGTSRLRLPRLDPLVFCPQSPSITAETRARRPRLPLCHPCRHSMTSSTTLPSSRPQTGPCSLSLRFRACVTALIFMLLCVCRPRVVAVFALGAEWQFKGWTLGKPPGSIVRPVDVFAHGECLRIPLLCLSSVMLCVGVRLVASHGLPFDARRRCARRQHHQVASHAADGVWSCVHAMVLCPLVALFWLGFNTPSWGRTLFGRQELLPNGFAVFLSAAVLSSCALLGQFGTCSCYCRSTSRRGTWTLWL